MDPIYIDAIWLGTAFLSGLFMKRFGLPTLLGFLASGFFLNYAGVVEGNLISVLGTLSDLGITLLLFTIGLKIKVKKLMMKEVLITSSAHMIITTLAFSSLIFLLTYTGISFFSNMSVKSALAIGFALSFSSTVFVVKTLEERGEMTSRHGTLAINILVMQDVFAVLFITFTNEVTPSVWALTIPIYLFVVRFLLRILLKKSGHGEMLTVFGFFAPLIAGALVFSLVHLKYDLGALLIGMLLAGSDKSEELYDRMMSFKDFFLIAFFINIGLTDTPTLNVLFVALFLLLFVVLKALLFFKIFSFFDLRARTNFLTSLSLMNYSEFGLIVSAVAYKMNLIESEWLIATALLMSFSFLLSAPLNAKSYDIFEKYKDKLTKYNRTSKSIDCQPTLMDGVEFMVVGIGSIGMPAFTELAKNLPNKVVAIDYSNDKIQKLKSENYSAVWGDTTDRSFWFETNLVNIKLVILAMSDFSSNYNTLLQINKLSERPFKVAVICHYDDEKEKFLEMGVDYVYNYKNDVGLDFADRALTKIKEKYQE